MFSDAKTGIYQIEWRENGRRCQESLKHQDFEKAKAQADEFAANYVAPEPEPEDVEPEPLTLGELFEMYLEEVTPKKAVHTRKHDKRAAAMLRKHFGARSPAVDLSGRE